MKVSPQGSGGVTPNGLGGCLLLAQSGHHTTEFRCPLLGVKRTLRPAVLNGAIMVPASVRLPLCVPTSTNPLAHFLL